MVRKKMLIALLFCFIGSSTLPVTAQLDPKSEREQTMSLDVKETDIRDVIRMISKGYGLNIILDKEVTGTITLHLTDAPIMEGLSTLAESNGWELTKEGSVYRIRKPVAKKKSLIRYSRGTLTVDVQNVNVLDFLKEISSKAAVSIVPDSKIYGKVSGKLYHVPLDDGIKAILEGNGFKVRKRRNIYQITQEERGTSTTTGRVPSRRPSRTGKGSFHIECSNGYITLDVHNGNLEDVINAISEQCESEIIIYGNLSGKVNAKLNDIPLTEAFALLLGGTKFTFVQRENVILIGDRNTATPSGKTLSKSEMIHLNHIKADEVPKILPRNIPANSIKVVKEQNALLVSGTSEDIVKIREFLETIDVVTPQIVIDVIVVEYTRDSDKDFGFEATANKKGGGGEYETGSNYWSFPKLQINRKGTAAKHLLGQVFGNKSFVTSLPDNFHMTLRLLETQKKAKVLAQPSITVLNGNKAKIEVGQTQYFKIEGGTENNPTTNFRPINFGISLNITPWISKSGQITAEINPEISNSMGFNEDGYPNLFRRSVSTTVRIDDGKTLVLGGLLRSDEQVAHKKVPILGDIPILGYLFKSTKKVKIQTNLVIYITPRIIDEDSYVDLEKELDQFDINERRGIFKRKIIKKEEKSEAKSGTVKAEDGELVSEEGDEAGVEQAVQDAGQKKLQRTKNSASTIEDPNEKSRRRRSEKKGRSRKPRIKQTDTTEDEESQQEFQGQSLPEDEADEEQMEGPVDPTMDEE